MTYSDGINGKNGNYKVSVSVFDTLIYNLFGNSQ